MRLYLDLCVLNRPFDYQGDIRISLETNIFIYILEKIENGIHELIVSEVLIYENDKNKDRQRKFRINSYFRLANYIYKIESADAKRAKFLHSLGFSELDALHITLAEKAKADYFITCDDNILKHYCKHKDMINISIISLYEFIGREEK